MSEDAIMADHESAVRAAQHRLSSLLRERRGRCFAQRLPWFVMRSTEGVFKGSQVFDLAEGEANIDLGAALLGVRPRREPGNFRTPPRGCPPRAAPPAKICVRAVRDAFAPFFFTPLA